MVGYLIGGAYCALAFGILVAELLPRIQTEHVSTKLTLAFIGIWALIQADPYFK